MNILLTSAGSRLVQAIGPTLLERHAIRTTDQRAIEPDLPFQQADLGHGPETNDLVRGMQAVVIAGDDDSGEPTPVVLDYHMRAVYNLLWAAREEGVRRIVYLSTLRLLDAYDPDLTVTERWRSRPSTNIQLLKHHLSEYVCREFAREGETDIACLRLGGIAWDRSQETPQTGYSSNLYLEDAAQAVEKAVTVELSGWNVFHIQSDVPAPRYMTGLAESELGFKSVSGG